jgi:hypothetical protein
MLRSAAHPPSNRMTSARGPCIISPVVSLPPSIAAIAATALVAAFLAGAAASPAAAPIATDSAAVVAGMTPMPASNWGVLPPPSDSSTASFTNPGRPAWEWPLYVPYAAVNYPLRWMREGVGLGVIWAEKKGLLRYINIAPVPKGVVPAVSYSQQEGLALGLNVYLPVGGENNLSRIRGMYSTQEWQKYTAGAIFNRGGAWSWQVGAGYRDRPNLEFYGIGPDASLEDLVYYQDERTWAGLNVRHRLTKRQYVALIGVFSTIRAREPKHGYRPTLSERYGNAVPGFGERSDGVMARLAWIYNTAKQAGNPERGTYAGFTVGGFAATNTNDVSFTAYRFELQKFVPLWYTNRVLALRGYLNFIDDTGSAPIPFQRMFINEVPDMFRGYDSGRWRDLGITGIDIEYRFPFSAQKKDGGFGVDTVLLMDIGQVFSEKSEIAVDNLAYSYGFGFRAFLNHSYIGVAEFVWSDEGFQFRVSTKQLFQFSRDVLFQGREETLIH